MTTRTLALLGVVLLTARVVAQPPAPPKPDGKTAEAMKPVVALSGAWDVTSATRDGKALADMEGARLIIAAKDATIQGKDGTKLILPFTVDPTKKPSAIDFPLVGGEGWLKLNGHFKGIYELGADSLKLCIGSDDKRPTRISDQGASLIVLKRQEFMPVATFTGHATEVMALAFSADGKRIVSVSAKDVRFWQADSGKEIASQAISWSDQSARPAFAIGPDRQTVALIEWRRRAGVKGFVAHVALISATNGRELLAIDPHGELDGNVPTPEIHAIAISPDGKHLVSAGSRQSPGGVVKIFDAKTGKEMRQMGQARKGASTSTSVSSVIYSADGKFIVAGTFGSGSELPEAGEVWIWNAADGTLVRMFTVADKDKVKASGPDYRVSAVAMSPDGKRVAAAVEIVMAVGGLRPPDPTELRIWDVPSGRAVHTLRGHKGWIPKLAFSPDGKWLASAGRDKAVRLWNTRTGKEVIALPFDTPQIYAVAFSPDGRLLAAGGGDGKKSGEVKVWALQQE